VGGLHGLVDHGQQLGGEGVQGDLVAEAGADAVIVSAASWRRLASTAPTVAAVTVPTRPGSPPATIHASWDKPTARSSPSSRAAAAQPSGIRSHSAHAILTAIALSVWVVGILIVSNVWKTPTYNMILAGDPEALPADWEATRQRYFRINWIQLPTTWAAFALFLVALISL
jgi:hypothetical protein